jgi:acyl carrier protein
VTTQTAGAGSQRSGGGSPPRSRSAVDLSAEFRAPAGELEQMLAELWRVQLGVDPIGVDDDFFELGGHSLMAAEMLLDVRRLTGANVSATTLFLDPTIADLAHAIESFDAGEGGGSTCDSRG